MRRLPWLVPLALLTGCHAILGIDAPGEAGEPDADVPVVDADLTPDVGPPEFTFTILADATTVPSGGGFNLIPVQIERLGSFSDEVTVVVEPVLPNLMFESLTIPPGETTGELQVSSLSLTIGNTFEITLEAAGGPFVHTDTVGALVTGPTGGLDVTFGDLGVGTQTTESRSPIEKFAMRPDGSFVGTGHVYRADSSQKSHIARFAADGTPQGFFVEDICGCGDLEYGSAIAALPDGGYVSAVTQTGTLVTHLRAFDAPHALDPGFDTDGRLTIEIDDQMNFVNDMVAVGDGVVVLNRIGNTDLVYDLFRFDAATGALDMSFGITGRAVTGMDARSPNPLALDATGRLWLVGSDVSTGVPSVRIQCRTADGALDPAWGADGQVDVLGAGMPERGAAIAFDDSGRVYVASELGDDADPVIRVRRFLPSGTLDPTWGEGGIAVPANPMAAGVGVFAHDLAVQEDGKLLLLSNLGNPVLIRFRTDGSSDPTWGDQGMVTFDHFPQRANASNIVIDPNGMIVLGGWWGDGFENAFVARYWF